MKKFYAYLIAIGMVASLAGCSGGAKEAPTTAAPATTAATEAETKGPARP